MNRQTPEEHVAIEDVKTRVLHMVSEMCSDETCAVYASLDQCAANAVTSRWSSPVKSFIPLLACREVEQCIKRGYCPETTG